MTFNPFQFLLTPAHISKEDEFYSECAKEEINLIDRVNGKPVAVFHYSIDRPSANWHSPKDDDETGDDSDDEPENIKPWLGWFGL